MDLIFIMEVHMSLRFAGLDAEVAARQEEIRQLFDGLSIEQLEQRRACLIQVHRRFVSSITLGAYQYLRMCMDHVDELILLSATRGVSISEQEVDAIEVQAQSDLSSEASLAHQILGDETDDATRATFADAYGAVPSTQVDA